MIRGLTGWVGRLPMPEFLRGSRFENAARRLGRSVKNLVHGAERRLRRGRVWTPLPSLDEGIWVDYDFALVNSLPGRDPLLAAFVGAIRPGQIVFDVGSFVGGYAIPAARRVGDGRVYAFEPAPESAQLLRHHVQLNGVGSRVRVVEAACSRQEGSLEMSVWPTRATTWGSGNALRNVYPREDASPSAIAVRTLRLDEFAAREGVAPDVVKVDVEGADLWVLEGAAGLLRSCRPLVFLEIHAFAWKLFGTSEETFRSFLADVRYDLLNLAPPHRRLDAVPDYGHALLWPMVR